MRGLLSRVRERVGVRVFACRHVFVSHEARKTQRLAGKFRQFYFAELCVLCASAVVSLRFKRVASR